MASIKKMSESSSINLYSVAQFFHEVFEILISRLIAMSKDMYSENYVEQAVHEIVRNAEKSIYPLI